MFTDLCGGGVIQERGESKGKGGGDNQEHRVGVKKMLGERNAHKVQQLEFRQRHQEPN